MTVSPTTMRMADSINFRRLCPEGLEEEAATLLQGIDQREKRRLIGFLRVAREIDIDL